MPSLASPPVAADSSGRTIIVQGPTPGIQNSVPFDLLPCVVCFLVLLDTAWSVARKHRRAEDAQTMSEFLEAVKNNDVEKTKQQLSAGININTRNIEDGTTALYWAACMGHVKLCNLLLEAGADVNITGSQWGSRPLHAAADRGNVQCAYQLIKRGAPVDAQTASNQDTALHKAAFRGHQRMVSLLLEHGANVKAKNKEGRTPRQEAQNGKHFTVHQILLDAEQRLALGKTSAPNRKKSSTQVFHLQREHQRHSDPREAISAPLDTHWRGYDDVDGGHNANGFVTKETNCTPSEAMQDIGNLKTTTSTNVQHTNGNHNGVRVFEDNSRYDDYGNSSKVKVNSHQMTSKDQTDFGYSANENKFRAGHEHEVPKSSLILLGENNGDAHSAHNDEQKELIYTRSQLQSTKLRLMQLEGYTEKLQLCVVKAREKLYALNSENEHLRKILASMGALEEQLCAAKEQIKAQSEAAAMDRQQVVMLQLQIDDMQKRYNELNVAYQKVWSTLMHTKRQGHFAATTNGPDLSTLDRPNGFPSSFHEVDTEHFDGGSINASRLTPRGLTSGSSSSTSSTSPSPPRVPPTSPGELAGATPKTSRSATGRTPIRASSRSSGAKLHPAETRSQQQASEVNTKPLFEAIAPVIATAGSEFMDMLTASLLFQTKKSITETTPPPLLDTPGTVWAPDTHYNILTEDISKPSHSVVEPDKQFMTTIPISYKDNMYQLKMVLDCIVVEDGSLPPADVAQIQFIQNIMLRVHHRNIQRSLHGFRSRPSPALTSLLPSSCQQGNVPIVSLHTVHPCYPTNLNELFRRARTLKSQPEQYFPERFILHLLYGTLSGLHFLRENSLVHGRLSPADILLTSTLQPAIANAECGFSTKSIAGEETLLTDVEQLNAVYPDVVPPEIDSLRKGWKEECSNKKLLREIYRTTDVYILGALFLDLLCQGWSGTESGAGATTSRNFPLGYSQSLRRLLQWMSLSDYRRRPSPKKARLRTGMLLFGPALGELRSLSDCQIWHQTKMMKFLLQPPPLEPGYSESDVCETVRSSLSTNHARLEHEYLTSVTAGDIWTAYSSADWQ